MKYFQQIRIDWINETIEVYGFINREHIIRKFRVSVAAASKDLSLAQFLNPKIMRYDRSGKQYILSKEEEKMAKHESEEGLIDSHALKAKAVLEAHEKLISDRSDESLDQYLEALKEFDAEHQKLKVLVMVSDNLTDSQKEE